MTHSQQSNNNISPSSSQHHFLDMRFPTDISYGSSGGPEYQTEIITMNSGHEQRNINWNQARHQYNISYGVRNHYQLTTLIEFFHICKGKAFGFRFKDWQDFKADNQLIATANGVETEFKLQKSYKNHGYEHIRHITKPVVDSVSIYINEEIQNETESYQLDYNNGIIAFNDPPAMAAEIRASFEFDVPVRFNIDHISTTLDDYGVGSCQNITLLEIR